MPQQLEVHPYNPAWPQIAAAEQALLVSATGDLFVAMEHIGSTAVPGLAAKPIIDMMGAVQQLDAVEPQLPTLAAHGYQLVVTDMPQRYFLRKYDPQRALMFHLHIVEAATWAERNERLLRDYLRAHPDQAAAYGRLKQALVLQHADDAIAYTSAKTAFIQSIVDQARDAQGLPRVSVWEE
ncbi:MAG: GrpB family protein [Chloroflexi bacterium]|nr:GrpB family protein [Chloroflexota bacterium]